MHDWPTYAFLDRKVLFRATKHWLRPKSIGSTK